MTIEYSNSKRIQRKKAIAYIQILIYFEVI